MTLLLAFLVGLVVGVLIEECRGRGLVWLVQEVPQGHPEFAYLDDDLVELPIPAARTCECAIAGDFKCPYERCLERGWDEHDVLTTLAEIEGL